MENKKGSLSTVFLVIAIIVIIIMGALLYFQKTEADRQIAELQNNASKLQETINNLQGKIDSISNTINNDTTELDVNDNIVRKLIEKIDFPIYATASIYNEGKFNLNTISNDLVLRLGWTKTDKQLVNNNVDNIGEYKQTATKKNLEECINKIFGNDVKVNHKSFTNIDVPVFYGYEENQGEIIYSNNLYTANYVEGGGGDVPFIHQEVKKVLKDNNKIEVYVKTAFIDTEYIDNDNGGDFEYIIYKNYKNDKFEEKLATTTSEKFIKNYSNDEYNGKMFLEPNSEIAPIVDQLNTYVYTFELDNATGEYYLSGFNNV